MHAMSALFISFSYLNINCKCFSEAASSPFLLQSHLQLDKENEVLMRQIS